jgi:hypothetical protein
MKRVLAATALIGFALLAGGCSIPVAYEISNRTDEELTVVVTRSDCAVMPSSRGDYVHEGVLPANDRVIYRADWGGTGEASCLRVLNTERLIVRQYPYRSNAEYGEVGANAFAVQSTAPLGDRAMPRESDFPGPSIPERLVDAATSVILVLLLLVLVTLVVALGFVIWGGFGLGVLAIFAVPFALGFLLLQAARRWRKRHGAPLN